MNTFVFVVCGAKEHIDTLNFSLKALKKRSSSLIVVITDKQRNEEEINHDNIIDIQTPVELNNHQASIYLKTSINKFLPADNLYCYLDTDVIAVSDNVDGIFNHFTVPITFARDHCRMDKFSPSAINCGCIEKFDKWEKELKGLFKKYKHLERPPEYYEKKIRLEKKLEDIKKDKLFYAWLTLKFWLSPFKFRLDNEFILDKKNEVWVDNTGTPVLYEKEDSAIIQIEKTTDFRCDTKDGHHWTIYGKDAFDCKCGHLQEQIQKTFGITVAENNWHHWNGGVFLFNDSSKNFLNEWHEKTMSIFNNKEWKTRDQGTLIATVYQHNLQNHSVIPTEFNLIADHEHDKIVYHGNLEFTIEGNPEKIKPHFIHVYHHWGDDTWALWRDIENRIEIYLDEERNIFNSLWIGDVLSDLELLTIRSFINHGHTFRLWSYGEIKTDLPEGVLLGDANEIIPQEQVFSYKNANVYGHGKGSYAGFSDIFRYKLLYERGGWWTDMDVTCLKPIFSDKPYYFRPHHTLEVVGNVMKCPEKSPLMKACYEEAISGIDENNTDWHKPIQILNDNIVKLNLQSYISSKASNHDRWDETSRFIWYEDQLPDDWKFIHWQNEEWRAKKVSKSDHYFGSALAKLLVKHGLLQMPDNKKDILINTIRHHHYTRKLREIF